MSHRSLVARTVSLALFGALLASCDAPAPVVPELAQSGTVANNEIITTEMPPCVVNGSLDGCFTEATTSITTSGTGNVSQRATIYSAHSTSTVITDNGSFLGSPVTTGSYLSNLSHSKSISFTAPNCQSGNHELLAVTTHSISISVLDVGNLSDNTFSNDRATCGPTFLTVRVSPSTIGYNSIAGITIENLPPSCSEGAVTVTSSNSEVAWVEQWGTNWLAKSSWGGGSVTITARCPDGRAGSATLTVSGSTGNPDQYKKAEGGGGGDSECEGDNWYYHMRWNYGRNEYEWTGGMVCLPGETRTIIYLGW